MALYRLSYGSIHTAGAIRTRGPLVRSEVLSSTELRRCASCAAEPAGLEPAAFRSTAGCSGRLSYDSVRAPTPRDGAGMGGGSRVSVHPCACRRRRRSTILHHCDPAVVKKRSAPPGQVARVGRARSLPIGVGAAATAVDAPPRVPCRCRPAAARRTRRVPSRRTHAARCRVARWRPASCRRCARGVG